MDKRVAIGCSAFAVMLFLAGPVRGQDMCVGDCDGNDEVAINELITCVNIALGSASIDDCPACDADGNGEVAVNELIAGVNNSLNGCDGVIEGVCGNSTINEGEDCDDGNNFGGDGCAANCTNETKRVAPFNVETTQVVVQTAAIPLTVKLAGFQTFTTGFPREEAVIGRDGTMVTEPGVMPVVVRTDEVGFEPAIVPGLVCACVRVFELGVAGPDVGIAGAIGCGENGLTDVDFMLVQDHNTNGATVCSGGGFDVLGQPCTSTADCNGAPCVNGNGGGLPDDPNCEAVATFPNGITSEACIEGTGETCDDPEDEHIGVCRSPRTPTFFGGQGPRGSAKLFYGIQIGLLNDAGFCTERRRPDGSCSFPEYGEDCQPCTDDDLDMGDPEILPATSSIGEAIVFDANNEAGMNIQQGHDCFGRPCITTVTGALFDCDAMLADPTGGISGQAIGIIFPSNDAAQIGDNVTSAKLVSQ